MAEWILQKHITSGGVLAIEKLAIKPHVVEPMAKRAVITGETESVKNALSKLKLAIRTNDKRVVFRRFDEI